MPKFNLGPPQRALSIGSCMQDKMRQPIPAYAGQLTKTKNNISMTKSSQVTGSNLTRSSCVAPPTDVHVIRKTHKGAIILNPPHFHPDTTEQKGVKLAEEIMKPNPKSQLLTFTEAEKFEWNETSSRSSSLSSLEMCDIASVSECSYQSGSSSRKSRLSSSSSYGSEDWRLRWTIDKVGRLPGQIRCVRDLRLLRNGNLVATEPSNARIQVFRLKTGSTVTTLGPESDSQKTAKSFESPHSFRRIQPTCVSNTTVDNVVAATDFNRILYINVDIDGKLETEVLMKDRTHLHGIATTYHSRVILSEITAYEASVGLYDMGGKIIREFKGDFKKPSYLSWNRDYDISAISDNEQRSVSLYDSNGSFLKKFGLHGVGQLAFPSGISWLSHGRLLVADRGQKKIVLFDLRNLTSEDILTSENGLGQPIAVVGKFNNEKRYIAVSEMVPDCGNDRYYLKMYTMTS